MLILAIDLVENEKEIHDNDYNCENVLPLNDESSPNDNTPSSNEEVMAEQENDKYCRVAATRVGHSNSEYAVDEKGLLIRNSPVDEANQIFKLSSLRQRILHFLRYPPIAKKLCLRRVYGTIRRNYY